MQISGKFVRCQGGSEETLVFLWDTETYKESDDADAQEQLRGGAHGAVGVDALFNPRRFSFNGRFVAAPEGWGSGRTVVLGAVIQAGALLYQCAVPGACAAVQPAWGGATVADGTATWALRGSLYECLRWLRDQYDRFFHAGIVKVYLDSDRYQFAQCIARSFAPLEGTEIALDWDATFTAAEPRRFEDTLQTASPAVAAGLALRVPLTAYAAGAERCFPADSGRKYSVTAAGMSAALSPQGPYTAPAWQPSTPYSLGERCRPVVATGTVYRCTRAGTSGTATPAWGSGVIEDPGAAGCQWTPEAEFADDHAVTWGAYRDYSLGQVVRNPAVSGWFYVCSRAGASGAAAPASQVEGAIINDPDANGCQWTARKAAVWTCSGLSAQHTVISALTYAGNAPGEPVIALTVPACVLNVVVSNLTTGESCTIQGDCGAAGELVVDGIEGLVTLDGEDRMSLFDGAFPELAGGANQIQVAWNEPGPSAVSVTFRNRWW
ncbi:MAG TPA: hypothetical protein VGM37_02560 [Armatimonadota bacterium]